MHFKNCLSHDFCFLYAITWNKYEYCLILSTMIFLETAIFCPLWIDSDRNSTSLQLDAVSFLIFRAIMFTIVDM